MKWLVLLLVVVGFLIIALSAEADPGHTLLVGQDLACADGCSLRAPRKGEALTRFVAGQVFPGDCVVGLQAYDAQAAVLCNAAGCSGPAGHVTPHPDTSCRRFLQAPP